MKKIYKLFFIWRLWLFLPLVFGTVFVPFRDNSLFTTIWQYTDKYSIVDNFLIFPWSNFDGVHYLAIASLGYVMDGRFLPLFPYLIHLFSLPLTLIWDLKPYGNLVFWSGLFLSNFFFLLSLFFLKKLLKLDYKEDFVNKVILALLVFPTSFFFVSIYTESLFLLLSILILLFARKKKWFQVIIFSMFLSVVRLPGLLILIPVVYEYLIYEKKYSFKSLLKFSKFLLIPLPLVAFSILNYYKWGNFLFFIKSHASLGNGREVSSIVFPLITMYRYSKIFLTVSIKQYEFWVAVIEFLSFIFAILGIWFSFIIDGEKIKKVRISYLLFAIALISLPVLSGTLTGFPRYLLLAFPIFIGIVAKISKSNFAWKVFIFCNLILQFIFLALFSRGWFIA